MVRRRYSQDSESESETGTVISDSEVERERVRRVGVPDLSVLALTEHSATSVGPQSAWTRLRHATRESFTSADATL